MSLRSWTLLISLAQHRYWGRWMTAWLTLQHILVILPVVRAQRDAAHLGSEVFSALKAPRPVRSVGYWSRPGSFKFFMMKFDVYRWNLTGVGAGLSNSPIFSLMWMFCWQLQGFRYLRWPLLVELFLLSWSYLQVACWGHKEVSWRPSWALSLLRSSFLRCLVMSHVTFLMWSKASKCIALSHHWSCLSWLRWAAPSDAAGGLLQRLAITEYHFPRSRRSRGLDVSIQSPLIGDIPVSLYVVWHDKWLQRYAQTTRGFECWYLGLGSVWHALCNAKCSFLPFQSFRNCTPDIYKYDKKYMSDGSYLRIWKVVFGRTPLCQKHHI